MTRFFNDLLFLDCTILHLGLQILLPGLDRNWLDCRVRICPVFWPYLGLRALGPNCGLRTGEGGGFDVNRWRCHILPKKGTGKVRWPARVGDGLDPSMDWIGLDWIRSFRELCGLGWVARLWPRFFIRPITSILTD